MPTLIDLTHTISQDMPLYPGSRPVIVSEEATLEREGYRELVLSLSTHTGTHIDSGYHLSPEGSDTKITPVDRFYGKGMIMDCRSLASQGCIGIRFLTRYEQNLRNCEFVLLHSGWSRYWGEPGYFGGFPVLTTGAAQYLTGFSLKGIGTDAPSFDTADSRDLPVHRILLGSGMILVENLARLDLLPESGFLFCCFPLKIARGDGSPVRAVGIVRSDE